MGTDRKVRLVATGRQNYAGQWLQSGDAFPDMPKGDEEDIMALGLGKKDYNVNDDVGMQDMPPRKPISAAKAKQPAVSKPSVKRKYIKSGLYKRRDMRAEE